MSIEKHDRHKIREVKIFEDGEGRMVREFVQVFGKDKGQNAYDGVATFQIKSQNPMTGQIMMQNMKLEFEFPLGTFLKKAFELFDEFAQKRMDEYQKQQQEKAAASRVVAAKTMPGLLGVDGKPLKVKGA